MKIIFSKKGFDSKYGQGVSPILPDGRMVSFPIPADKRDFPISYQDIYVEKGMSYESLMQILNSNIDEKGCHLDPDLRSSTIPRAKGWKPIFGQSGNDSTHLIETGKVEKGDLFLFYGTFKKTTYDIDNQLIFDEDHKRHIIFLP